MHYKIIVPYSNTRINAKLSQNFQKFLIGTIVVCTRFFFDIGYWNFLKKCDKSTAIGHLLVTQPLSYWCDNSIGRDWLVLDKLVVGNHFIFSKLRNNVVANRSWFSVSLSIHKRMFSRMNSASWIWKIGWSARLVRWKILKTSNLIFPLI